MRRIVLLPLLAALAVPGSALSQEEGGTLYFQVDYMKVPEGGGDAYVAVERDLWRPIHEERVRQGTVMSWSVYGVRAGAPHSGYNYVTVTVFDDFAKLENPFPEGTFEAAFPAGVPEGFWERTFEARKQVHTEIWQAIDAAQAAGESGPSGRYILVNYMLVPVGGESEYVSMEQEDWKPLHQAEIDAGLRSGWGVYGLAFPSGKVMHYNFGTVDYFENLADIVAPLDPDVLEATHPGATLQEMIERANRARTIYKSELWEAMESTGGE
jgi:hypothetical protein